MRVAWITVRCWADFCSTTTDALAHGLVRKATPSHCSMLMSKEVITSSHGNMWLCPDQLYQGEGLQRWQKADTRGSKNTKTNNSTSSLSIGPSFHRLEHSSPPWGTHWC